MHSIIIDAAYLQCRITSVAISLQSKIWQLLNINTYFQRLIKIIRELWKHETKVEFYLLCWEKTMTRKVVSIPYICNKVYEFRSAAQYSEASKHYKFYAKIFTFPGDFVVIKNKRQRGDSFEKHRTLARFKQAIIFTRNTVIYILYIFLIHLKIY